MKITALIPARIGSKRIPKKNLERVGGIPLVARAVANAINSHGIDKIRLLSDSYELDDSIPYYMRDNSRYMALARPPKTATDTAQLEDLVEWYLDNTGDNPDYIVLLQPTSPLRTSEDVSNAINQIIDNGADSLLSGYVSADLIWHAREDLGDGRFKFDVNYDPKKRPRSQDALYYIIENGAIYIFKPGILKEHKARIGGKITSFIMPRMRSFEVDKPEDLDLVRAVYEYQNR